MEEEKKGRFLLVFVDESRQFAEHYMVIGGVIIHRGYEQTILTELAKYRKKARFTGEFKWKKVSPSRLEAYRGFVDHLFDHSDYINFKCIVVDNTTFDRRMGDKELGFYKLMYQFLLHSFGRYLRIDDRCIITLDYRTTKYYKLSTLYAILNNGLKKKYKHTDKPVRFIQPIDSKMHDLIQLADVFIGAIGYEMNGLHKVPNASPGKIALAKHIAKRADMMNLQRPTTKGRRDFGIWHFKFNKPR